MALKIPELVPASAGPRVFAIMGNAVPPRDPDDDDDEEDEEDDDEDDEPPVVREPDED